MPTYEPSIIVAYQFNLCWSRTQTNFIALLGGNVGNVSCSYTKELQPPTSVSFPACCLMSRTQEQTCNQSAMIRLVYSFAILVVIVLITSFSSKFPKHHIALTNAVSEVVLERGITPIFKRSLPVS